MRISIDLEVRCHLNGEPIQTAPTVAELHALVGSPSRITGPKTPAPPKHRSNQIHVYDDEGVYFIEHHYTRRVSSCKVVFREGEFEPFPPRRVRKEPLLIAGEPLSHDVVLASFLERCPLTFEEVPVVKWLRAANDDFSVILNPGSVEISWPHDPWGKPSLE